MERRFAGKIKALQAKNKSAPRVIVAPNTIIEALMHIFSDKSPTSDDSAEHT